MSIVPRGPRVIATGGAGVSTSVVASGDAAIPAAQINIVLAAAKRIRVWNFSATYSTPLAADANFLQIYTATLVVRAIDINNVQVVGSPSIIIRQVSPIGQRVGRNVASTIVGAFEYLDFLTTDFGSFAGRRGFGFTASLGVFNTDAVNPHAAISGQILLQYEIDPSDQDCHMGTP